MGAPPSPVEPFTTGKVSPRAKRALDRMHEAAVNFDLDVAPRIEDGWRFDDYRQDLPPERPGPPMPNATFAVAKRLMEAYEFADPEIVRAVYLPDRPLADRVMVLEGRFYGLKFVMGLRVGGVKDERAEVDGRPVHVWGWNYRTLAGHLESGQMDYEVWKFADTGEVQFRIHAFSKAARIENPVVRLGFRVFGRWMQRRFARNALRRMRLLVERRLIEIATGVASAPGEGRTLEVKAVSEAPVDLPEGRQVAG
jgi:uncharacterized protein (UPF0548 family)